MGYGLSNDKLIYKMKIGIFTQPIYTNYGGILQAYALQETLRRMGHSAKTLDIPWHEDILLRRIWISSKRLMKFILLLLKGKVEKLLLTNPFTSKEKIRLATTKYTKGFVYDNINLTAKITSGKLLEECVAAENFDILITGSDQVWRPMYTHHLDWGFLSFAPKDAKKIAYAASFGVDYWEYDENESREAKKYLSDFSGVSVREESAVLLCKRHFGIDARWVADPTMLLDKADYIKLSTKHPTKSLKDRIMSYILDPNEKKTSIVHTIETILKRESVSIRANKNIESFHKGCNIEDFCPPSVEQWLQAFDDSYAVVTDSFHGTVFSIIYNVPFVVILNEERGATRIESLLKKFGLTQRIVYGDSKDEIIQALNAPIDWHVVNETRSEFTSQSLNFLYKSLQ